MKLPELVIDRKTKYMYLVFGFFLTIALYQSTNRMHLWPPQQLPFTWIDRAVPFWPWTVWIYFSEYIIFFAAYYTMRSDLTRTRYFYSYTAILLFSCVFFIFYPVTFPRENYGLGDFHGSVSALALGFLRDYLDSPANCLPSLHVSSCYISALCFWKEDKKKFSFFFFWSTLVAFSTMTTKQHYFIDIWSGLAVTLFFYWIFFEKVKYEKLTWSWQRASS